MTEPDAVPDPAIATLTFDAALAELQAVVGRLEGGDLPLEGSIELYARGVALHGRCAELLDAAELRVARLSDRAGGPVARALDDVGGESD
ncbi:MAG: exodeoxyribonuclease VII small subunit [Chloroflexota bacterium]